MFDSCMCGVLQMSVTVLATGFESDDVFDSATGGGAYKEAGSSKMSARAIVHPLFLPHPTGRQTSTRTQSSNKNRHSGRELLSKLIATVPTLMKKVWGGSHTQLAAS